MSGKTPIPVARAMRDIAHNLDLVAAGSSLGGARPKVSILDEGGALNIAKFPKPDELPAEDVCAWEKTALDLAAASGISVPESRLLRIGGRSVLLLRRFDRRGDRRIPYLSGLTAVQGEGDGVQVEAVAQGCRGQRHLEGLAGLHGQLHGGGCRALGRRPVG